MYKCFHDNYESDLWEHCRIHLLLQHEQKQGMNAQPCETTIALTRCIDCACESWHAIKGSLTHRPSSQGWAPGVLPLCVCVCVCVCLVVCQVFLYLGGGFVCGGLGGWFWVLSPSMLYTWFFHATFRNACTIQTTILSKYSVQTAIASACCIHTTIIHLQSMYIQLAHASSRQPYFRCVSWQPQLTHLHSACVNTFRK